MLMQGRKVAKEEFFAHIEGWPRPLVREEYRHFIAYHDHAITKGSFMVGFYSVKTNPEGSDFRIWRDTL